MKVPDSDVPEVKVAAAPWAYVFALVATLTAFLIRLCLDPYLGEKLPFATSVIALTLVAWYGGFVPSLMTCGLSFLLVDWFFLMPRHTLMAANTSHFASNLSYVFVSLTIIFFGRTMHLARRRADANARQANNHLVQLREEVGERKRAEEEVRRLNTELEQRVHQRTSELVAANQDLESFSYSVSHDLRAPLRHLDGYAQLLEEEYGPQMPPNALSFAKKIRQGSRNMGRLVDDLLNLARIGKAEIVREPVPLKLLVDEVLDELKPEVANRSIEWEIGELPVVVCDAGLARQVFVNLISNAIKYTRTRAQARIQVGHMKQDAETVIFIRDNGVGFSMKYADKLFGVFQRLHRADQFEGSGVGLATAARITRRHGGRIWAEAETDKGATFLFTLGPESRKTQAAVSTAAV